MTRAVFLDRDGVLSEAIVRNGKPYAPHAIDDLVIVPGASEATAALRNVGFRLIVVTNQPDIARGKIARVTVDDMNEYVRCTLNLDAVEVCEHDDSDNCDCRKPKAGMLLRAAKRDNILLSESFLVGDRWRDVEAGRRAGCRTVLIGDGYGEGLRSEPEATVNNFREAVDWILEEAEKSRER
jgi:D-glycero-D-manno-heptose 1,7-bisphosphate phosphatase